MNLPRVLTLSKVCYDRYMNTTEKLDKKRALLLARTSTALQVSLNEAHTLLSIPRHQSVRINTLREDTKAIVEALQAKGATLEPVTWMSDGFFVNENLRTVRDDPLTQEGGVYIQNAASWLPVLALDPQPGDTILDVCAAPGGKTSHIAQVVHNKAIITANDNSRPRLMKLQRNLERLGVHNVEFTLHDATRLTQKLTPESFDKILLDAPCSGEGMMTLDDKKGFDSWSVAHIKRLQQLQKKLVVQAWQLLKPGGTLVYSTCTMAPEENEAVVDYLLRHNDTATIQSLEHLGSHLKNRTDAVLKWNEKHYSDELKKALRLIPSAQIEAFFVVKITKKTL